jgi:hypothetical protein
MMYGIGKSPEVDAVFAEPRMHSGIQAPESAIVGMASVTMLPTARVIVEIAWVSGVSERE